MAERIARPASIRLGKWAGLLGGPAAWFVDQQIMSSLIQARCPVRVTELVVASGVFFALLALVLALTSWRARAHSHGHDAQVKVDRFIATMSAAIAVISVLAILFASAAGAILQCQR